MDIMARVTFPKIGEKHRFAPLFTAAQAMKGKPRLPEKIIFVYSIRLERMIRKRLRLVGFRHPSGITASTNFTKHMTRDKKLALVRLVLGAPFTAIMMEEAIACGGKEFLILGTAGAINDNMSISDVVLCSKAVRDEGTSHHYLKTSTYAYPDNGMTRKMSMALSKNGIEFSEGATWTTDAGYVETVREVKHYKKMGVLTVEMEAAALFAVARKRKVKAAAVFAISDILGKKWSGFNKGSEKYRKLAEIAGVFRDL
jgi:uridine phosphorylase